MSSTSERARRDLARTRPDEDNGLQFGSVKHALRFAFARGAAMSAPLPQHPRGYTAADGSTVVLRVDGGRGGSIDEVHATLMTISEALACLGKLELEMIELTFRDELTQAEIGKRKGFAESTVSTHLHRGVSFLDGWLRHAKVVR